MERQTLYGSECGHFNGVAGLTGFSYKKMFGHFTGTKKTGHVNEVTLGGVPL